MSDEFKTNENGYNEYVHDETVLYGEYKSNNIGGQKSAGGIGINAQWQDGLSNTYTVKGGISVGTQDVTATGVDTGDKTTCSVNVGFQYGRALANNFKVTAGADFGGSLYDQKAEISDYNMQGMSFEERLEQNTLIHQDNQTRILRYGKASLGTEFTTDNRNITVGLQGSSIWTKAGNNDTHQAFTASLYAKENIVTFDNGMKLTALQSVEVPLSNRATYGNTPAINIGFGITF